MADRTIKPTTSRRKAPTTSRRAASASPKPARKRTAKAAKPAAMAPPPAAVVTLAPAAAPVASPAPAPVPAAPNPNLPSARAVALLTAMLVLVAFAVVAAFPAGAQGNSGTIKIHDGPDADPDTRNEPHVTGDFYVEGMNMAADGGDLLVYSWPPTGDMTLVLETTWEADDGTPEFHFLAGPFELPCGHYRAFAYNGDGPDDPAEPQPGGAKKKTFWVDCEEPEEPEPTPTSTGTATTTTPPTSTTTTTSAPPCETDCEPAPRECPSDLVATPNGDGTVTLTFTPADGSDGTNVYRADGGGDFEYLTTLAADATSYLDDTTVAGTAYEYTVTALYGDEETTGCAVVEVTAIPVFPTIMAFGLASLLGAGVYLALTVRRKP